MFGNKFPFRRQYDSMQCGIACLQMMCSHFGKEISLNELDLLCGTSIQGVSMRGMKEAANSIGLHAVCGKFTEEQLRDAGGPCIIHWNQNHFVVLYKVSQNGRKFYVADPGKGSVKYDRRDFLQAWLCGGEGGDVGIAMFLEPLPQFYEGNENQRGEKRSFSLLFSYVRRYRGYFGQIALGLLLGGLLQVVVPFLTQMIVDEGIFHGDMSFVMLVLAAQLVLISGSLFADFVRRWILLHIGMRINLSLLGDFFAKLLKLPMAFFDKKLIGDLLQRMSDHSRIEQFLTVQSIGMLFSLFCILVLGGALLIYSFNVFLVFLAGSFLYGLWIAAFMKKRRVLDYIHFDKQATSNNITYQFISSVQEIKLQGCEERRRLEWEGAQVELFQIDMQLLRLQQNQEIGSLLIEQVKNAIITVITAQAVINGTLSLGGMFAIQFIVGQLQSPVSKLMNFIYSLQDVRISMERINEIHGMRNEKDNSGEHLCIEECMGDISVDDVVFRYNLHMANVLDGVSFKIKEGEVTAIVGMSGSGKTTLLKLLLGFYRPQEGRVLIGEKDLQDYDVEWWRRQCGVVMQEGVIFSESIARNIAVDDASIDYARMKEAAGIACISDFIERLPMKYNTVIGRDGVKLSQGQKQRVLIARAVYKNPRYLIFDEATNSLDANNEKKIVENLTGFYKGRTVIVVAHRLSTVKKADTIIVFENGKVVEIGCHSELSAKKGVYYNLVKNQLELGQ